MQRKSLLAPALAVTVLLGAAACGDDDDSASTTTTTADSTSTTADGSTTTTAASGDLASGPSYETTSGPSGAGCTPGEVTTLPSGWWAGEIKQVYESGVELDVVCWFSEAAATEAAEQDGQTAENDYYIRDSDTRTFRVEFPPGMSPATCVGDSNQPFACQVNDVLALYRESLASDTPTSMLGEESLTAFPYVWVHTAADGTGDYLYMQFTP